MAFTQQNLDEMDAAIASGSLTVRISTPAGTRERTYRSIPELIQARALIAAALRDTPESNYTIAQVNRGFRRRRGHE